MSAIAGFCYWDGTPVSDDALTVLAAASQQASRDAHGGTFMPFPWLALQAFVLPFDRLSTEEHQPVRFGADSVLTWDGRLDNREDLLLVLHDGLAPTPSDACLAAAAYARWGTEAFRRLIGDWSIALWDATAQTVVLACDYMGVRPLYYRILPNGLAWATRLEALVDCFDLYHQPSDDYIVGRLINSIPAGYTPFRSLQALVAGHILTASQRAGVTVRRYWTFAPATVRYRDPCAYTDQLRCLLSEGVRVRLRSDRTVWCHLSGGWDSSVVTSLAHRLAIRGMADARTIQPLSLIHTGAWSDCDERPFIASVERRCGLHTMEVLFEGYESVAGLLQRLLPTEPASVLFDRLDGYAAAAGDRVILTGAYGDDIMLEKSGQAPLLEVLHGGHVRQFLTLAAARARDRHIPLLSLLTRMTWETHISRLLTNSDSARGGPLSLSADGPRRHAFGTRYGVSQVCVDRASLLTWPSIPPLDDFPAAKRKFAEFLYKSGTPSSFHRTGVPSVYRTHPYTHRPLAEFMLAAPTGAFQKPGAPQREGMRRAFADILPPDILNRRMKMMAGSSVARSVRDQVDQVTLLGSPRTWHLVQRGYLDRETVEDTIMSFRAEGAFHQRFPTRWLYVEAWLQALTSRQKLGQVRRSLEVA